MSVFSFRNWSSHDPSTSVPVALKFVKTKEHFEQEIRSRRLLKDEQELGCVIAVKGYSISQAFTALANALLGSIIGATFIRDEIRFCMTSSRHNDR